MMRNLWMTSVVVALLGSMRSVLCSPRQQQQRAQPPGRQQQLLNVSSYAEAFTLLIDHEKEHKASAVQLIERELQAGMWGTHLHRSCVRGGLLDIGAGNGGLAIPLSKHFEFTQAVEPNPIFRDILEGAVPRLVATVPVGFLEAATAGLLRPQTYKLIVCSHMLYHVPFSKWGIFIRQALALLARDGLLVIVLQAGRRGTVTDVLRQLNPLFPHTDHIERILRYTRAIRWHFATRAYTVPRTFHIRSSNTSAVHQLMEFLSLSDINEEVDERIVSELLGSEDNDEPATRDDSADGGTRHPRLRSFASLSEKELERFRANIGYLTETHVKGADGTYDVSWEEDVFFVRRRPDFVWWKP